MQLPGKNLLVRFSISSLVIRTITRLWTGCPLFNE